jgi:hypothetical protein
MRFSFIITHPHLNPLLSKKRKKPIRKPGQEMGMTRRMEKPRDSGERMWEHRESKQAGKWGLISLQPSTPGYPSRRSQAKVGQSPTESLRSSEVNSAAFHGLMAITKSGCVRGISSETKAVTRRSVTANCQA